MKNNTLFKIAAAFVLIFLLASCAKNIPVGPGCEPTTQIGFWYGLWHGLIAPIDLIMMLFKDDVVVFAPNNNGIWYSFGFIIGSSGWGILGGKGAKNKKSKTCE